MASKNHVKTLHLREIGETKGALKNGQMETLYYLKKLYDNEWFFDHPWLFPLHELIKRMVAKYVTVSEAIQAKMEKRKSNQTDIECHVFLVQEIIPLISDTEGNMLMELVEEIKMSSL